MGYVHRRIQGGGSYPTYHNPGNVAGNIQPTGERTVPEMTYAESRKRWIATANKLYDRDKASLSKLTNRKEFVNSSLTIDLNLEPLSDDERRELKND